MTTRPRTIAPVPSRQLDPPTSLRDRIIDRVTAIGATQSGIVNPDRRQDSHEMSERLFNVYVAQELASWAERRLKETWAALQVMHLNKDDALRTLGTGEHTLLSTPAFIATAKIGEGQKRFDLDTFINMLVSNSGCRISREKLVQMAEDSKVTGKPTLSKKVLEA